MVMVALASCQCSIKHDTGETPVPPVDAPFGFDYAAQHPSPFGRGQGEGQLESAFMFMPQRKPTKKKSAGPRKPTRSAETAVRVRRVPGSAAPAWEFVHPRCATARADDVDEVRQMIEHGETEIATDELRWLLNGCSDFIDAHRLLGELALATEDYALARGHFGYAYRIGQLALKQARSPTPVPYSRPANQSFFEAGKGLAYCLKQLDKREMAADVIAFILHCDPSDPLGVKGLRG